MKTKLLALLLVFTIVISTFGSIGVMAFDDVPAGTPLHQAVSLLNSLGIMLGHPDGTFQPNRNMPRAELTVIILRGAMRINPTEPPKDTIFPDVPITHWASVYINEAVNQGIINPAWFDDGNFHPDEVVCYDFTIAMITNALGYSPMSTANGGFPVGYWVSAVSAGITRNIDFDVEVITERVKEYCGCCDEYYWYFYNIIDVIGPDRPISRGTVARLLFNALSTPLMIGEIVIGGCFKDWDNDNCCDDDWQPTFCIDCQCEPPEFDYEDDWTWFPPPYCWCGVPSRLFIIADGINNRPYKTLLSMFHNITKLRARVNAINIDGERITTEILRGFDAGDPPPPVGECGTVWCRCRPGDCPGDICECIPRPPPGGGSPGGGSPGGPPNVWFPGSGPRPPYPFAAPPPHPWIFDEWPEPIAPRFRQTDVVTFNFSGIITNEILGRDVIIFVKQQDGQEYDIIISLSVEPIRITEIWQGSVGCDITVFITGTGSSAVGKLGYVFIASYLDDRFLGISDMSNLHEIAGGRTAHTFSNEEIHENANRIRVFLWDGFDTMTSLGDSRDAKLNYDNRWEMI